MTKQDILDLGFTEKNDGTGDERGVFWIYENESFRIEVDAWMDISLTRRFSDGTENDPVNMGKAQFKSDLQSWINWMQ